MNISIDLSELTAIFRRAGFINEKQKVVYVKRSLSSEGLKIIIEDMKKRR